MSNLNLEVSAQTRFITEIRIIGFTEHVMPVNDYDHSKVTIHVQYNSKKETLKNQKIANFDNLAYKNIYYIKETA